MLDQEGIRVRRPLLTGYQPVDGLWFSCERFGMQERAGLILAHWQPGARAHRFADGDLLQFARPESMLCEALAGWPLVRQGRGLCSARLDPQELQALPFADLWLVRGGQVHALQLRDAQFTGTGAVAGYQHVHAARYIRLPCPVGGATAGTGGHRCTGNSRWAPGTGQPGAGRGDAGADRASAQCAEAPTRRCGFARWRPVGCPRAELFSCTQAGRDHGAAGGVRLDGDPRPACTLVTDTRRAPGIVQRRDPGDITGCGVFYRPVDGPESASCAAARRQRRSRRPPRRHPALHRVPRHVATSLPPGAAG